jgi:hypothetical protein
MVSSILSSGADRGGEKETISQSQGTGRVSAVYRPFLPESLNEQINRARDIGMRSTLYLALALHSGQSSHRSSFPCALKTQAVEIDWFFF